MNDFKKLDEEIEALKYELSVTIPEEIKTATELGDLRENAEFSSAVFRQHYASVRLNHLLQRRRLYNFNDIQSVPKDRVGIGSLIKARQKESNKIVYFKVAIAEVSNDEDEKVVEISKNSPIGVQIMNKKEGDTIMVGTPSGTFHYKILKITTIHDLL